MNLARRWLGIAVVLVLTWPGLIPPITVLWPALLWLVLRPAGGLCAVLPACAGLGVAAAATPVIGRRRQMVRLLAVTGPARVVAIPAGSGVRRVVAIGAVSGIRRVVASRWPA